MSDPRDSITRYSFHTATRETLPTVCRLVEQVHGEGAARLTAALALHLPGMTPSDVLWLRDDSTGEAVSTLSLIPWRWRLGTVEFPALETGIVATAEAHRSRGLSSWLMAEALKVRKKRGVAVSVIQGIPYFYRRFGYEHAVPLETHVELEFRHVAPLPSGWHGRLAARDDLAAITRWAASADAGHDVASLRSPEHWRYRLDHSTGTETEATLWVLSDPEGTARGFFAVASHGFGEGLIVCEAGGDEAVWPAVAALAAQTAHEHGKPFLRLNLGSGHPFVRWPQSAGGKLTVNLPPEVLPKLLFGWKTPAALREFYPDFFGPPAALDLLDRLFPQLDGFCNSVY